MLKNYFKMALRQIWRNKITSVINVLGLSLGLTACLLILQYVTLEKSYDLFHQNRDRLYRVAMFTQEQDQPEQSFAFTFPAVAPAMKNDFPEVEEAIRMRRQRFILKNGEQVHTESVYFVDAPFLTIFDFPMKKGDRSTALDNNNAVVISADIAKKYFGDTDPVGKTISVELGTEWASFEVTAVLENVPENSHMDFDILFPYTTYSSYVRQYGGDAENNWGWSDFYTYVLLKKGIKAGNLQAKLPEFAESHMGERFRQYGYTTRFELQPLPEIHLNSDLGYELGVNGNARYVWAMTLIAFFILFIAWINYVNLSTARSLDRAKEVGVRKVVGAGRAHLIRQFLFETLFVNAFAFLIAFGLFRALLPGFAELTGKAMEDTLSSSPFFWLVATLVFGGGAISAGLYPAFILSAFKPIQALKSHFTLTKSGFSDEMLRKFLVGLQFCFSVALIAGTLALYRQILFMRSQDIGVNINQTLVFQNDKNQDSTFVEKNRTFINALKDHPDILNVSASGDIPGKEVGNSWNLRWSKMPETALKRCRTFRVDDQFMKDFGLELVAGRMFSDDFGTEENNAILNETAVKTLGFSSPEAALGQDIVPTDPGDFKRTIVGVIKDYHQESLRFDFKPIVYFFDHNDWVYFSAKVRTSDMPGLLAFAERTWKTHFKDAPFNHFFLDDFFDRQYKADLQFGWIIGLFTLLAILVACLGLFGLTTFNVARREKEIGIRKVLGASVAQILTLISRDFIRLLLISSIIALPAAWFFSKRWLADYAFSIHLNLWFFLFPLGLILAIAVFTVGIQSMKAALSNPADSLRNE